MVNRRPVSHSGTGRWRTRRMSLANSAVYSANPRAYRTPATMYANQRIQPTPNAARTFRIFLAKCTAPPDSGKAVLISAKLNAVMAATTPLSANVAIAPGPVARNAVPASTRTPPPTIAPTPMPVAESKPKTRRSRDSGASVTASGAPPAYWARRARKPAWRSTYEGLTTESSVPWAVRVMSA